jgi:hypothetical protein
MKVKMSTSLTKRLTRSSRRMPIARKSQNHNGALQTYFLEVRRKGLKGCDVGKSCLNNRDDMMKKVNINMS